MGTKMEPRGIPQVISVMFYWEREAELMFVDLGALFLS